ncbi:MAG: ribulose-phosphate 3-epimerase [Spirochaetaceae bacterium]|nr:ribulose-phosphate 3-epimerase [Spirochaetaceae bacterium]
MQQKVLCASMFNLPIENMKEEIIELDKSGVDMFHVDIMDGTFVPNFAMSVREIDLIRKLSNIPIDCHMMVMEPRRYITMMADHGCDMISIHPEAELIPTETLGQIRALGKKPGIVVNPMLSLEMIKEMLPLVDYITLMGVNPGFAGRDFMDYLIPKFKDITRYRAEKNLKFTIILDGGADERVIRTLYHDCGIEGFILGKQLLFFQNKPYKDCVDFVRTI